jgi:hypothetical protein
MPVLPLMYKVFYDVVGNQLGETNLVVVVLVLCTATLKAI